MAITFFGVATTPADNSGSSVGPTVTITPPASMVDGDLVFVSAHYRASTATLSVSNAGGQTWNTLTQYNTTNIRAQGFWCRFNGTWSANPIFTVTSGTNNIDAQMLVFRPTSATRTWTFEAQLNDAAYGAPGSPFTVTITGRTTTAASTVTIAAWHSIDDNTWGTLSGTGWSKTSLGAQYRNNDTNDNSSTYAYYIATSAATAVPNVSQNQATLGGDAGSTGLFTFAETVVTATPTGVAGTSASGSLGLSLGEAGLLGVEATASAGTATVAGAGASNATATPSGVASTSAAGTLAYLLAPVITPTGVGIGAAVGTLIVSAVVALSGVSSTSSAGTLTAVGASAGIVPIGGVVSTSAAGSLGLSIAIEGVAGVESAAAVGTLTVSTGGVVPAAGQPSSVFATAQAGSPAVSLSMPIVGVSSGVTAESLLSSSADLEVDGNAGTASANGVTANLSTLLTGNSAAGSVGSVVTVATAVVSIAGAASTATVGNLAAISSAGAVGIPGGVLAEGQAGTIAPAWTWIETLTGVEATAAAGTAAVEGGDSSSVETFPSGVEATIQLGALSTGEVSASLDGVSASARAGSPQAIARAPSILLIDALTVRPVFDGTVQIEPSLDGVVTVESVT